MIVVFGSLNIDMVMQVRKMPQPGDTVLCSHYQMIPGGKGANQALAAARAGASVKLFGKVGDDDFGRNILNSLKESTIDLMGVEISKEDSTGCAAIAVDDHGENMITVASGVNFYAQQKKIPDILLSSETTLLLQMETPAQENWNLIRRAKKLGAKVILNCAPAQEIPQDILKSLDILIVNTLEASVLALHLGYEVISPLVTARRLAATFDMTCIVTLGGQGAVACSPEGTWEVNAMSIQAIDTTAAGDAFVGVLAASIGKGLDLPSALRRASVASGLACLVKGAQSSLPLANEIESNLKKVPLPQRSLGI